MKESQQLPPSARRRFKPYPAYEDSGVEWLGEVPAHWSAVAFRRLIGRIEQGWSPVAEDRLASLDEWAVIKLSAVNKGRFLPDEHKALPADLAPDTRYEIREGDFLLTRANTPDLVGDACVARGVRPKLMLCDLVYRLQLRDDRLSPTFLAYWLVSRVGRYQIEVDARGASQSMVKVSQGHIRAWTLVMPPFEEQRAIATFLDRETARIDALVAKKERLIELFQEESSALITRTVTKGLDPNVSLKDSGIELLEKIPAHWETMQLGQAMQKVMDFRGRTPLKLGMQWGGDILAISAINVRDGHIDLSRGVNYGSEDLHDRWMTLGPTLKGDVVFTTEAPLGNAAVIQDDGRYILSQRVVLFRANPGQVHAEYLLLLLRSSAFLQGVESQATGSTAEGIKRKHLLATPVWLPPLEEQSTIVALVHARVSEIAELQAEIQRAISLLQEFRTALISAAVTGKIDVREEVA